MVHFHDFFWTPVLSEKRRKRDFRADYKAINILNIGHPVFKGSENSFFTKITKSKKF